MHKKIKKTAFGAEKKHFFFNKKIMLFLLFCVAFFTFANTIPYDFIYNWDDNINITENNYIKNFTWEGIQAIFSSESKIEEPRLTLFTFAVQYFFWELNPMPYHIFNILLHVINCILVFFLVKKITPDLRIVFFTTLLFAVHPLRSESVAWVTGRKDLLYSMFFLSSLLFYQKYLIKKSLLFILLVFIFAKLSFLSKIQALSLPVILLLFDYIHSRKFSILLVFEKILLLLILLNFMQLRYYLSFIALYIFIHWVEKNRDRFENLLQNKKLKYSLISGIILCTVFLSLNHTILPILFFLFAISAFFNLSFFKDKISVFYIKYRKRIIILSLLIGFSVFMLFIFSHFTFLQNEFSTFSPLDRIFMASYSLSFYIIKFFAPFNLCAIYPYPEKTGGLLPEIYYYSIIGISIAGSIFTLLILKFKNYRKIIIFGLLFFLINIFMVLHIIPIKGRVITAERYSYLAYLGLFLLITYLAFSTLGKKYLKLTVTTFIILSLFLITTSFQRNKVWENGFVLYTDIISKKPDFSMAYNNRGYLYYLNGNNSQALSDYSHAINTDSANVDSYYNRALAYVQTGKMEEAFSDCNEALKFDNKNINSLYLRGYLNNKFEKYQEAINDFNKVLAKNPKHHFALYNRGESYRKSSNDKAAINDFTEVIKLQPGFADAYNSRGIAYSSLNMYEKAISDYNEAIKINNTASYFFFNRATAYIQLNQTKKACEDYHSSQRLGHPEASQKINEFCR